MITLEKGHFLLNARMILKMKKKDKFRLMRADENKYKEVYKHNIKSINSK